MTSKNLWTVESKGSGIYYVHLKSWKYFSRLIDEFFTETQKFIWRGQASSEWKLESSLDRLLKKHGWEESKALRNQHLKNFKYSSRGRKPIDSSSIETDNEWWALGQHYGLATPLLDWSNSPYVAAFFAFADKQLGLTNEVAIFGVDTSWIRIKNAYIKLDKKKKKDKEIIEIVRPLTDYNPRLVSQGGLFTHNPDNTNIEGWLRKHFDDDSKMIRLCKIHVPIRDKDLALQSLDLMNITYQSLFPDLFGSASHCNMRMKYDEQ